MNEIAQAAVGAASQVAPEVGILSGLASYGPMGIIMAAVLGVGIYTFKRLLDRALTAADASRDATLQKLDRLVEKLDDLREEVRGLPRELSYYIGRSPTPAPEVQSHLHHPPGSGGPPLPGLPRRRDRG